MIIRIIDDSNFNFKILLVILITHLQYYYSYNYLMCSFFNENEQRFK
jgi:hypothetical protein